MIFVGDVAIPANVCIENVELPDAFMNAPVIANLEGAIVADGIVSTSDRCVFSNDVVVSHLKSWNVKGVTMANNHITDIPDAFVRTKELLERNGINYCGAGREEEASEPMWIEDNGERVCVFSYGWEVIGCKPPNKKRIGVNSLEPKHILSDISSFRHEYSSERLYVTLHWDVELERFPMPAHRALARKMVEAGADAVIGHHPHCVQSYELHMGKPIFYSIGNWMFPQGVFNKGMVRYPEYSFKQMAVEIRKECVVVYGFRYDIESNSVFFEQERHIPMEKKSYISDDYLGMSDKDYVKWFKKNRIKNKILPVYKYYNNELENRIKDRFVRIRQMAIRIMRHV